MRGASLTFAGLCLVDSAIAYHFNQELPKIEVIRNDAKLHALTADTEHYMTVDITEKAAFERVVGLTDNLVDGMKAYTSGIPIVRLFSTSVFCCDPRGHLHTTFFCVSFYCDGDFHDGFNKFVDKHW